VRRRLLIWVPLLLAAVLVALGLIGRRVTGPGGAPAAGPGGDLERRGPTVTDEVLSEATRFPGDATLKARVESELFRDPDVPKGEVNVDTAYGVVTLRGRVASRWVGEIAERVAAVEGVTRVQNLLQPRPAGA
jgi:hypothetical protein